MTAPAYPRHQAWRTPDGFRVTVSLYKRGCGTCDVCGGFARHYVSAGHQHDGREAHADYCDEHRPERGAELPPPWPARMLPHVQDGNRRLVIHEYYRQHGKCDRCDAPAACDYTVFCDDCDHPNHKRLGRSQLVRIDADGTTESVEERIVHDPYELDAGCRCKEHWPSIGERAEATPTPPALSPLPDDQAPEQIAPPQPANALAATVSVSDTVGELLTRARRAHESIQVEPTAALMRAFEAGDALIEAKARVKRGEWKSRLAQTGIPPSTALYMQLARKRERILAAGCTSIREARRLLADKPPQERADRDKTARPDRYQEGYDDGYRRGLAEGDKPARAESRSEDPLTVTKVSPLVVTSDEPLPEIKIDGPRALKAYRSHEWVLGDGRLFPRSDRSCRT